MRQRPESLIATALRHGLRADVSVDAAALELIGMAGADPVLIKEALGRIGQRHGQPTGPVAEYARRALRRALGASVRRTVEAVPG